MIINVAYIPTVVSQASTHSRVSAHVPHFEGPLRTVAASIQTYGILIPGKRPCGPKLGVMSKCPWALTRDTTVLAKIAIEVNIECTCMIKLIINSGMYYLYFISEELLFISLNSSKHGYSWEHSIVVLSALPPPFPPPLSSPHSLPSQSLEVF